MSNQLSEFRIGVDIGGTFTDIVAVNQKNGIQFNGKVLTTPKDPSEAVLSGVKDIIKKNKIDPKNCRIIHGTTLVANALIERKGVKTALLTTQGFKDVLEIGREWRYDLFSLDLEMPSPIVPRHLRFEIEERINFKGEIIKSLDETGLIKVAKKIAKSGVETLAIVFMHSFKNAIHEKLAKKIIEAHVPNLNICLSSIVSPEIGEYERTSTSVANAYVQPIFKSYVTSLVKGLKKIGITNDLFLMLSDGGIVHQKTAIEFPIRLVQSGPAGGAQAATLYGKLLKQNNMENSAVEWYEIEIDSLFKKYEEKEISYREFIIMKHNLFYQAKEMEKEIIRTAYLDGMDGEYNTSEQYYNETFKKD